MPYKPPSRCLNVRDGCRNLAVRGQSRCAPCQRVWEQARNARRVHYQGDWAARAKAQTTNVHWCECTGCPQCKYQYPRAHCGRVYDLTADHLVPQDPRSPLRTLCRRCNASRGNRVAAD